MPTASTFRSEILTAEGPPEAAARAGRREAHREAEAGRRSPTHTVTGRTPILLRVQGQGPFVLLSPAFPST